MNDEHVEKALEVGLGLVGALLLGGLAVLTFGRLGGDVVRRKKGTQAPPSRGQVSPERHQNIGASSPR
jgi:hypothetical protein